MEKRMIEDMATQSAKIDPKLQFNACTAGIKEGGLRSVSSINMIVCYIVANLDGMVTSQTITEALADGMIANLFEVSEALSRMITNGVIRENEDSTLSLAKGNNEVELIEKDLPLSVRESSINLCQKIIAREKYKRENKVDIVKIENGYNVTLRVSDNDKDYMKLTLYTPTDDQAQLIKEKFLANPINVYETLIDTIFSNEF